MPYCVKIEFLPSTRSPDGTTVHLHGPFRTERIAQAALKKVGFKFINYGLTRKWQIASSGPFEISASIRPVAPGDRLRSPRTLSRGL